MADAALGAGHADAAHGRFEALRACLAEPKVVVGGGFILFLLVLAIFAPWIAPKDPLEQDVILGATPPVWMAGGEAGHWLGTDDLGRDILSRVIYGSRVALTVAFVAASLAAALGSVLGLLAGWRGGWVDAIVSRAVEIWMAFPPVLLSILLVAVVGAGVGSVIAAIAIIDWTRFCRVVRAETINQASSDYVTAARAVGFSRTRILIREIFPNVLPVLIALVSLEMGIAVIVEAILSFVGLSVSSDTPTWGGMIAQGRQFIHQGAWILAAPLIMLFLTVLAFNLLGEGLRRALDPVLQAVSEPILAVHGLSAVSQRDRTSILHDVSLTVDRGETRGLVGESGAGKTTIGKAILGILPRAIRVTGGKIRFDGQDLLTMPEASLRRLVGERIALIPQDPMTALNPGRRIEGQLTDGLRLWRGLDSGAARKIALNLLEEVHIRDPERVLGCYPHELSGGMRQRVLIAAAFAMEPKLIVADEPTTALDVTVQKQILRLVRAMQRAHGTAVLFVTHNLGVVAQVCDDVTLLFGGRVIEQGRTAEMFERPRHPYTQALLDACPRYDRPKAALRPVPAEVIARLRAEAAAP